MTCREFVESICARLNHELEFNQYIRFEQHASVCTRCATYLDGYRQTVAATKRAFNSPDLSDEDSDLTEDLVEQIINSRHRLSVRRQTSER